MFLIFPINAVAFGLALFWWTSSHGENVVKPKPVECFNMSDYSGMMTTIGMEKKVETKESELDVIEETM